MKRIISAIAVVAIVSSALAFKTKPLSGAFCGNLIGTSGCQIIPQLKEVAGPVNYHVKSDWNGTQADCTTTCETQIRLVAEN
jgi:hypothetical protein